MILVVLYVLFVLLIAVGLSLMAVFIRQTAIKVLFRFCYPMRLIV